MAVVVRAVLIGMLVAIVGAIPRNLRFAANRRYYSSVPWILLCN